MMVSRSNACASSVVMILMLVGVSNAYNNFGDDYDYDDWTSPPTTTTTPDTPPSSWEDYRTIRYFLVRLPEVPFPYLFSNVKFKMVDYNVNNVYDPKTGRLSLKSSMTESFRVSPAHSRLFSVIVMMSG